MLLTNATIATLKDNQTYGLIEDGAIALANARIAWVGRAAERPAAYADAHKIGALLGLAYANTI